MKGNTPLHLACMQKGNIGIVKEFIDAVDCDVQQVNALINERYVPRLSIMSRSLPNIALRLRWIFIYIPCHI